MIVLDDREASVLDCLIHTTWTTCDIALELGIGVGTARRIIGAIYEKFEVPNRAALVWMCS